jgi:secondary thiamine-phosphate synthase enzyme
MKIIQKELKLKKRQRGFHLITREILSAIPEISTISTGTANIFIKHTSASLTINENADPDVRHDMEVIFNKIARENDSDYHHTMEGPDDMPAHAKASILGPSLTIPITEGRLNLGTWQGIYLCEHRNYSSARNIVITITGI